MKRTLFAFVAALLLAVPAACVHPHHGHPGGGPGGPGCRKHQDCGCKCRHQQNCPQPDCPSRPDCPKQQLPAAK